MQPQYETSPFSFHVPAFGNTTLSADLDSDDNARNEELAIYVPTSNPYAERFGEPSPLGSVHFSEQEQKDYTISAQTSNDDFESVPGDDYDEPMSDGIGDAAEYYDIPVPPSKKDRYSSIVQDIENRQSQGGRQSVAITAASDPSKRYSKIVSEIKLRQSQSRLSQIPVFLSPSDKCSTNGYSRAVQDFKQRQSQIHETPRSANRYSRLVQEIKERQSQITEMFPLANSAQADSDESRRQTEMDGLHEIPYACSPGTDSRDDEVAPQQSVYTSGQSEARDVTQYSAVVSEQLSQPNYSMAQSQRTYASGQPETRNVTQYSAPATEARLQPSNSMAQSQSNGAGAQSETRNVTQYSAPATEARSHPIYSMAQSEHTYGSGQPETREVTQYSAPATEARSQPNYSMAQSEHTYGGGQPETRDVTQYSSPATETRSQPNYSMAQSQRSYASGQPETRDVTQYSVPATEARSHPICSMAQSEHTYGSGQPETREVTQYSAPAAEARSQPNYSIAQSQRSHANGQPETRDVTQFSSPATETRSQPNYSMAQSQRSYASGQPETRDVTQYSAPTTEARSQANYSLAQSERSYDSGHPETRDVTHYSSPAAEARSQPNYSMAQSQRTYASGQPETRDITQYSASATEARLQPNYSMMQSEHTYSSRQPETREVTQYSAPASEARSKPNYSMGQSQSNGIGAQSEAQPTPSTFNKIQMAPNARAGPPMPRLQQQSRMSGVSPRNMPTLRYPVGSLSPTANRPILGLLPPSRISGNRSPVGQFTGITQNAYPISQGLFPHSGSNMGPGGSTSTGTQQHVFDAAGEDDRPTIINQYQYIVVTERDPGRGHQPHRPMLGTCWGRNPQSSAVPPGAPAAAYGQRHASFPMHTDLPPGSVLHGPQTARMLAPQQEYRNPMTTRKSASPSVRSMSTHVPRHPHTTPIMAPMTGAARLSNSTVTTPIGIRDTPERFGGP